MPTSAADRRFLRWCRRLVIGGLALIELAHLIDTKDSSDDRLQQLLQRLPHRRAQLVG